MAGELKIEDTEPPALFFEPGCNELMIIVLMAWC